MLASKTQAAEEKGFELLCSLLFDEMSLKKVTKLDGKRYWGYVDIGVDMDEPALEVLVLMVACLRGSWKLPIAYFFISSLNGAEKANIVRESLSQINVTVVSVTCDGAPANFTMFKQLGCDFNQVDNLLTTLINLNKKYLPYLIRVIC